MAVIPLTSSRTIPRSRQGSLGRVAWSCGTTTVPTMRCWRHVRVRATSCSTWRLTSPNSSAISRDCCGYPQAGSSLVCVAIHSHVAITTIRMSRTFSVVGLGKLGASMAAGIASQGHQVIGVDVSHRAVELVNSGRAPVQETGLDDLIAANRDRLRATEKHEDAILNSELTFVIVPTPSDERGAFSLQYASFAFREIGKALANKHGYHTVVLTSTVLPGATRYGLLPVLERYSGKTCGHDFGLCYS